MVIDIITIFPDLFNCFLSESLISRAIKGGFIKIKVHDLRSWTKDKRNTVDDRPFGGGLGMVLKPEPIFRAVLDVKKKYSRLNSQVIVFTPRGKVFKQKTAQYLSENDHLIMVCGRYEGIDERVCKFLADMNISLGKYVLMGGELPAMVVCESVIRYIPGVIGKSEFLSEKSGDGGFVEYPQYTRPEIFHYDGKEKRVPRDLVSGDHGKIKKWRKKHGKTF